MVSSVSRPYTGHIEVAESIATKIKSKHGITPDEVREACSGGGT